MSTTNHSAPPDAVAESGAPAVEASDLAALKSRIEELEEKNLRLIAEGRNVAQRAQREKSEAIRYAEADFARELLPILDDLERTLESARTAQDTGAIVDGVRIMYENFLKLLKTRAIVPIEAVGRTFDPQYHEALLQQPSDTVPAGVVLQEVQRGYTMHDRVLRTARVVVSAGAQ